MKLLFAWGRKKLKINVKDIVILDYIRFLFHVEIDLNNIDIDKVFFHVNGRNNFVVGDLTWEITKKITKSHL